MAGELESVWGSSPVDIEVSSGSMDVSRGALTESEKPAESRASAGRKPNEGGLPAPSGWTDGLTETDGPRMWDKLLASEQARNARHKRTATVVLVDVLGLEQAGEQWGTGLALQLFVQLARELGRGIRRSDSIARIGPARFGVLLTETDEISAINFVDRIKEACCGEFNPAANGLRLAVGWASPAVGGRLADAIHIAEGRLLEARLKEE
jgi:diguanylate cyclase (GGDEF)-like protein